MAIPFNSSTWGKRSRYFSRVSALVAAFRSRCAWSMRTAGRFASTFGSQSDGNFSRNSNILLRVRQGYPLSGAQGDSAGGAGAIFDNPGRPVGEGAFGRALAILRQLFVANHPVGPKVHNFDFERVRVGT